MHLHKLRGLFSIIQFVPKVLAKILSAVQIAVFFPQQYY